MFLKVDLYGTPYKWKLPYIQSTIIDNDSQPPVLALGITETWLTESVSEAQSELKGFQCIRSDRDSRKEGTGKMCTLSSQQGCTISPDFLQRQQ